MSAAPEIRVLQPDVASAIAAGEVVERPASVVKELVENALDADATTIQIEVEGAGTDRIYVADNGHGIRPKEMSLAVERHATSKLRARQDLFNIGSLGFRGEALSAIAAVARLEIVSRVAEQAMGQRLRVEAGQPQSPEAVGAPVGTSVDVRDLFFNVPARKAFLKSEATERRHIRDWVGRYAMAYPDVRFQLQYQARRVLHSAGDGDRLPILAELFGLEQAQQMLPIPPLSGETGSLIGYVSPPSVSRASRKNLTFFVNGRWVQDSSLAAAVLQAYHGLLMVGRYPIVVLLLQMPPDTVDVNVHPAKAEVRFHQPGQVFAWVQRTVRATLLRQSAPPSVGWTAAEAGESPGVGAQSTEAAWALRNLRPDEPAMTASRLLPAVEAAGEVPLLRLVGQVGAAYLVTEGPDGIYLIDQHAAHERILFDRMMTDLRNGQLERQGLLEAATVEFDEAEHAQLSSQLDTLARLGFDIEPFGPRRFRVRAVPAMLANLDPVRALRTVVDDFEENEAPLQAEIEAVVAARVCKRAAIKSGQVLSLEEQRQLVRDLEASASPRTCPHGRPTLVHLSVDSLERQFGRRG